MRWIECIRRIPLEKPWLTISGKWISWSLCLGWSTYMYIWYIHIICFHRCTYTVQIPETQETLALINGLQASMVETLPGVDVLRACWLFALGRFALRWKQKQVEEGGSWEPHKQYKTTIFGLSFTCLLVEGEGWNLRNLLHVRSSWEKKKQFKPNTPLSRPMPATCWCQQLVCLTRARQ